MKIFFLTIVFISCTQNNIPMKWTNHGGRNEQDYKVITKNASAIFIASIVKIKQLPIEYSQGDIHVPTIWGMDVIITPEQFLKGKIKEQIKWIGRYRINHPDPMLEDIFWKEWVKDENLKAIIFLSENNQTILHVDLFSEIKYDKIKHILLNK